MRFYLFIFLVFGKVGDSLEIAALHSELLEQKSV